MTRELPTIMGTVVGMLMISLAGQPCRFSVHILGQHVEICRGCCPPEEQARRTESLM